ncbi:hypothetical protein GY45DRAFT_1079841 [Cubamyces sp. BRFM 1775]|nr:hypothetical protein GY45DRAFT_1079841 [Cubamyces sp. BRFM 1775]
MYDYRCKVGCSSLQYKNTRIIASHYPPRKQTRGSILLPLAKVPRFMRFSLRPMASLATFRAHRGTQGKSALSSLRQRSAYASTRHFCHGQRSSVGDSRGGESCKAAEDSVFAFSLLMLGRYGNVFTDLGGNDASAQASGPAPPSVVTPEYAGVYAKLT